MPHLKRNLKGMVFGVFDGLHEGHKAYLSQALSKCAALTVVLTPSEVSEALKKRKPLHSYERRKEDLVSFDSRLRVVSGDSSLGEWKIFDRENPDVGFLGYDQGRGIVSELEKRGIPYERLLPYKPETYKSSLLNRRAA